MWPRATSLHTLSSSSAPSSDVCVQSDRLRCSRPSLTCWITLHDIGATYEYHGHLVSFEWQFRQERSRMALTFGGIDVFRVRLLPGREGGLVRRGPTNCATTSPAAATRSVRL